MTAAGLEDDAGAVGRSCASDSNSCPASAYRSVGSSASPFSRIRRKQPFEDRAADDEGHTRVFPHILSGAETGTLPVTALYMTQQRLYTSAAGVM
ncbi:MAG TPA: hypothetical protein IAB53_03130 [Candidatus Scybalocola faecipullorum]|nr:hypothetical protein [Candidatus Scybalocola faecipullorum]